MAYNAQISITGNNTRIFLMVLFSIVMTSCKKDGPEPDYPPGSHQYINDWILDSMQVYYYWNNSLPNDPDLDKAPLDFFAGLKNPQDRFSRIYHASVPESYYPSPVQHFGFEIVLYDKGNGDVQTTVALVVPNSPAQRAGLLRGQVLTNIDGTEPTASNIKQLIRQAVEKRSIAVKVENVGTIALTGATVVENSVYLYKIFQGVSRPTGYLFYNSFDGRFRQPLQQAFSTFKQAGVTELIIDLRYNAGGDVGVCAALAAMLSKVNASDTFLEYRGNSRAGVRQESFARTIAKTYSGTPYTFAEIEQMRLPLERVFILTGGHTASAAEFLVKSLRPWTPVVQIGEPTLGKDMASFSIRDGNPAKDNAWTLEPMVFKLYNAHGEGDYPDGLEPDIVRNELHETLLPLGDPDDPLIQEALARISGRIRRSNKANIEKKPRVLYDSRIATDRRTNFIVDP